MKHPDPKRDQILNEINRRLIEYERAAGDVDITGLFELLVARDAHSLREAMTKFDTYEYCNVYCKLLRLSMGPKKMLSAEAKFLQAHCTDLLLKAHKNIEDEVICDLARGAIISGESGA